MLFTSEKNSPPFNEIKDIFHKKTEKNSVSKKTKKNFIKCPSNRNVQLKSPLSRPHIKLYPYVNYEFLDIYE